MTFRAGYPQASDGLELRAFELWRWYYDEAEAFDRTVCTGPMGPDGIMPATVEEHRRINAHAQELAREVGSYVRRLGVDDERSKDLRQAAHDATPWQARQHRRS